MRMKSSQKVFHPSSFSTSSAFEAMNLRTKLLLGY